jgi:citrate lyase synthetase
MDRSILRTSKIAVIGITMNVIGAEVISQITFDYNNLVTTIGTVLITMITAYQIIKTNQQNKTKE